VNRRTALPLPDPLTSAARSLATQLLGPGRYCIAYGSHARDQHGPSSDLDVLQVTPAPPSPTQARRLQDRLIQLHREHGLHLDTEVAYEVKLVATHAEVRAALSHAAFPSPAVPGQPVAPAVPSDAAYLNSASFKQRLILNALTSPNVFLGGDVDTFTEHTHAAEASLAVLSMRILADQRQPAGLAWFTLSQALDAILVGPGEATGEDFLGYHRSPSVLATLNRGLHRLIPPRIAAPDREATWRPGPSWAGNATATTALGYWWLPQRQ
jgi:predicted nucleotidyltransferase